MTARPLWILTLGVIALLAVSLAQAGTQLAWHLAGRTAVQPAPLTLPQRGSADPAAGPEAVIALAPFGAAPRAAAAAQDEAPLDSLGLELRGVFVDSDPDRSRAFIARSGRTEAYGLGAEIAGATLTEITALWVTLDRGGSPYRLGFPLAPGAAQPETPAADDAPADGAEDRLAALIAPGRGSLDLRDPPPPEDIGGYINMWRERIIRDPLAVMETIGLEATPNGYTITENPNIGVTLAGLRTGDVVTRVNGQQVGDPERDRKLYDEIAASGYARLEVVRDGNTMTLSFPLR